MEEWVEYYTNISASIDDDNYFKLMITNSWNIDEDAEAYKKHGKGWKNEDNGVYARNDSKQISSKPTQRIGMESSENPFATTDKYYTTH